MVEREVQLLHLADRALAQRVAEDGGALVAQAVPADQNFGHRGISTKGISYCCNALRVVGSIPPCIQATELVLGEVQLPREEKMSQNAEREMEWGSRGEAG